MKNRKRLTAGLTAAVSIASMLTAFPGLTASATEIFKNDFEINYGGWYAESPGDVAKVTAYAGIGFEGSRGMKVTDRTSPDDGAASEKDLYLVGGKRYDYSVRVSAETDQHFTLTLTTVDTKTGEETVKVLDEKNVKGGEWATLSATYKAPDNSKSFKLKITTDTTDDFIYDDVKVIGKQDPVTAQAAEQGLKDMLVNFGIRSGNIFNGTTINNDGIKAIIEKDCNAVECENETKPDATLVQSGSSDTNIQVTDRSFAKIASWCADKGIAFRGHTMVWHSQTPDWFFKENMAGNSGNPVSESTMNQRLESYIKNMFNLYAKNYPNLNLYAYDVCNECMNDSNGGPRTAGYNQNNGHSPWVMVYGDNHFIDKAFEYARKYAPKNCHLFYNDYNEYAGFKRDAILTTAKRIKAAGNLDGVGMQSHINANANDGWSGENAYLTAMKMYLEAGLEVQITELDISTDGGKYTLDQQANRYKNILDYAIKWNSDATHQSRVTLFQVWGPNDKNSWVATDKQSGKPNSPLLYDGSNQPKAAYNALIGLVSKNQWGDGTKFSDDFVVKEPEVDGDGYWYHYTFESGTDGMSGRSATVGKVSDGYNSNGGLAVSGREDSWNGAITDLSSAIFKPGQSYSFSTLVKYDSGSSTDTFKLTLQYKDGSGETQWPNIAEGTASKGEWIQLSNQSFKIPSDATDISIYVETDTSTIDFVIDEFIGAPDGTKIPGPGKGASRLTGDADGDGTLTAKDLAALKKGIKGKFANNILANNADVDQSGEVDAKDAQQLQQFLLGKIDKFTAVERPFEDLSSEFSNVSLLSSYKKDNENNPLYTQRFGADPGWLVYDGRLYVYTTADEFAYKNNAMIENDYSSGYINVLSTADLVNWTDHGQIPVAKTRVNGTPIARWANNAWAPDAAWKNIKGQDKFFLYFANNGSGIGVLSADDPTFSKNAKDPLGRELISRSTPNSNVIWLFDPGVYYDPDTDTAIMAYGGGVKKGEEAWTKQGRIVQLGDDMTSIVGTPIEPGTPYLFEDSSMIKIGNLWYYSFCHNWDVPGGANVNGNSFSSADIGYMTSTNPLKDYQYQGVVFKNTGNQRLDNGGNNHHSIIEFKGEYYVLYHSRQLEMRMGVNGGRGLNYRSPCIDKATLSNGKITCNGSQAGVSQIETLNPYETVQAETMSNQSTDISVSGLGNTTVNINKAGAWIRVKGAEFSKGAKSLTVRASSKNGAVIRVTDGKGNAVAYIKVPAGGSMKEITTSTQNITGTTDLTFAVNGQVEFDSWKFS